MIIKNFNDNKFVLYRLCVKRIQLLVAQCAQQFVLCDIFCAKQECTQLAPARHDFLSFLVFAPQWYTFCFDSLRLCLNSHSIYSNNETCYLTQTLYIYAQCVLFMLQSYVLHMPCRRIKLLPEEYSITNPAAIKLKLVQCKKTCNHLYQ